jgi:hypothetical protein
MTHSNAAIGGRSESALSEVRSLLIAGETLEAWAIQQRVFALARRRMIVAATSGRFITIERRLLGGFDPVDVRWQDLKEVRINVGLIGATLTLIAERSADLTTGSAGLRTLVYAGLHKEQAQQVYRVCQAQDQAWREKRRIREMEELRARAGGVQILGSTNGSGQAQESSVQRLQEARRMLEAKLISDAEYEAIKARLINNV